MQDEHSEFERLAQSLRNGEPGADIELQRLLMKGRPSPQTATSSALRSLFSSLRVSDNGLESFDKAISALYARRRLKQIDKYRRQNAQKRTPEDAKLIDIQEDIAADGKTPSPEQVAQDSETAELLDSFIQNLSEPHQTLLKQIYWEELSLVEIAARQKLNESTIRGRRDQALRELKGILLLHGKELNLDE